MDAARGFITAPTPRFVELFTPDDAAVRAEIEAGLLATPASVAPKYFYDSLGSRLFEAITALDEYYPTRTEAAIFAQHARDMAALCAGCDTLIDLGAGNCDKAARLLPLLQPAQYVAVDISVAFVRDALNALQRRFEHIDMLGIGADFSTHLALPDAVRRSGRLFFYPGSSIGNFAPADALHFLRRVHAACGERGALLIGVDLVKPTPVLEAAYDDALGVTAAFNLNVLRHVNALLGTDFALRDWQHVALYDAAQARIEMHLQARRDVTVHWPGHARRFAAGERLHTENSYKYTVPGFTALLRDAGFAAPQHWCDAQGWFGVFVARSA